MESPAWELHYPIYRGNDFPFPSTFLCSLPCLIDGKANGVHVLPHLPLLPTVLLDQPNEESAAPLRIIRVLIFFLQLDQILRVRPESVWNVDLSKLLRGFFDSNCDDI